jgi:Mg2+ and Co2+ transporter CorA
MTVISSVFIPLTFIAGVYGMNFVPEFNGRRLPLNMPELYHPTGIYRLPSFDARGRDFPNRLL